MGHHGVKIFDNRKKIDFKQTIIDFQEKTILTSLAATTVYEMHRLVPAPSYYDGWVLFYSASHCGYLWVHPSHKMVEFTSSIQINNGPSTAKLTLLQP